MTTSIWLSLLVIGVLEKRVLAFSTNHATDGLLPSTNWSTRSLEPNSEVELGLVDIMNAGQSDGEKAK